MTDNETNPPLSDFSPITALALCLFGYAKWLSPMQFLGWLGRQCPGSYLFLFRARSELTYEEIQSKEFTKRRARAIETYMISWIGLELVLVVMSCLGPWTTWLRVVFAIAVTSRIVEIVQINVNAALFDALRGRPDERFASRARMIVLASVNFLELCLCFGVIYAADLSSLSGAGRPLTVFYFSIITQLTIGYGDVYPIGWLRLVAAAQGLVGVLFIILVFGRFMASLPRMRELFGEKQC